MEQRKGWVCPKCHRIINPDEKQCKALSCEPKVESIEDNRTLLNESH